MSNTLFLVPGTNELIIMDDLSNFKNRQELDSPYWCARLEFWHQWEMLFWNESLDDVDVPWSDAQCLLHDTTYWNTPPTLALPERAQSLLNWSHCIWCGFPLDSSFRTSICDTQRLMMQ